MSFKITLLKTWAILRRLRRRGSNVTETDLDYRARLEPLLRAANPFASWNERANWLIDIAEWIRHQPTVSLLDQAAWQRVKRQRVSWMLDWLDQQRDVRRVVRTTLQKTLREAVGPELFSATGLPREPAFFSELSERLMKLLLPRPPLDFDLSALLTAMFPEPEDAEWLLELDDALLIRLWQLCGDGSIAQRYMRQIDEALLYLVTMIVAVGISPAFRQRLEPRMPLNSTPFVMLRHELENYLPGNPYDEATLRSVRMLIAVCQAQTDRIYTHLDEHGVSVGLVYHLERMRAQLTRVARLIDLRATHDSQQSATQVQLLLVDLTNAHHRRSSIRSLVQRSFSLLARKMVERNADHGEHYIARDRAEYRAMLKAASIGGVITAFAALGKLWLSGIGVAHFFEGALIALNFGISFLLISACGGVLATKQPAVTAPALASRMSELETVEGLRALLQEIAWLLRSQTAAVFGNVGAVVPVMLGLAAGLALLLGAPVMTSAKAHASLHSLSIVGVAPLYAAFTGVLLWLASLIAGFADNWFALRRLREALAHHRRLLQTIGAARAEKLARWLESNISGIVGNLALAGLLGMIPVLAQFFGLPLDVRHVTLSSATLTLAASSLGWSVLSSAEFWVAVAGIVVIGVLNVSVAFACALTLALRARDVPARVRRLVFRAVLRRVSAAPGAFLFPENVVLGAALAAPSIVAASSQQGPKSAP